MIQELNAELQEANENIAAAKEAIEFSEKFERLTKNADYQAVIEENYFREESIRLVQAKSNPNLTAEQQKQLDLNIIGIGQLRHYFFALVQYAEQARNALAANQTAVTQINLELDAIAAEEAE